MELVTTKPAAADGRPAWQRDMVFLSILYRILECGDRLHVVDVGEQHAVIARDLEEMRRQGLLRYGGGDHWEATDEGRAFRDRMVAMYDQVLSFEIFAAVDLTRGLTEDEGPVDEENGLVLHVYDHVHDPRFARGPDSRDLRLAMITFVAERLRDAGALDRAVDPHRVVFLQKLADGELRAANFWAGLRSGAFFRDIEEIVASQYRWTDVAADPDEAAWVMENVYTAGMLEQRKRDGDHCPACRIPLAIFAAQAREEGGSLERCPDPDCGAALRPPVPPAGAIRFACPRCRAEVHDGMRRCRGCGAILDSGLPEGAIVEGHPGSARPWRHTAGHGGFHYRPHGWYDPFDPVRDAVAFGVLCAVLFD